MRQGALEVTAFMDLLGFGLPVPIFSQPCDVTIVGRVRNAVLCEMRAPGYSCDSVREETRSEFLCQTAMGLETEHASAIVCG